MAEIKYVLRVEDEDMAEIITNTRTMFKPDGDKLETLDFEVQEDGSFVMCLYDGVDCEDSDYFMQSCIELGYFFALLDSAGVDYEYEVETDEI